MPALPPFSLLLKYFPINCTPLLSRNPFVSDTDEARRKMIILSELSTPRYLFIN